MPFAVMMQLSILHQSSTPFIQLTTHRLFADMMEAKSFVRGYYFNEGG